MDITPIYDLRARLRAAMIAGTNLLPEDFRLKRAVEAIAPLEQASPVFAKIGQLARALLDPAREDKEGALLDTITLVDAVLCTQGAVAVSTSGGQGAAAINTNGGQGTVDGSTSGGQGAKNEIEKLPGSGCGNVVTNAPYSVVSALTEALTSSGSGHYSFVTETHANRPELFSDYRVKAALVQALGASYSELAYRAERWLREEDVSLLPLLQNNFDPNGKKEMVRRVWVMEAIAPREANEFFLKQLPDAGKEVRQALIFALRHCPENEEILWDLEKTERGNCKKTVYQALAYMESSRAEQFFNELYQKNPQETMKYLGHSQCTWASRLVAREMGEQLKPFLENKDYVPDQERAEALKTVILATSGKTGTEIIQVLDKAFHLGIRLNRCTEDKKEKGRLQKGSVSNLGFLAGTVHSTISITADPEMSRFAMKLYEEKSHGKEDWEIYFPAAALAHLLADEDCSGWLSKQLIGGLRRPTKLYELIRNAWSGITWNDTRQKFLFQASQHGFEMMADYSIDYVHELKQDISGRIADVLMKCQDEGIDAYLLPKCINPRNDAERTKLEEYFYKRALEISDNRSYMRQLKSLGCRRCEGLAVHYFKRRAGKISLWEFKQFESYYLPGDTKAKYEELLKAYDLIKRGKVQIQKGPGSSVEDFVAYLEGLKC